jgi:hypothetical protein
VKKPKKLGVIGIGVGFCLGLLVGSFAYYFTDFFSNLSTLCLYLAPASIIYMLPIGRATLSAYVLIALIIAISNAFIYGFVFFMIGQAWVWFSR